MEINSEIFDDEESAPTTEQFTVVFMTYKRHNLIKDAVAMFKGIRELHQVVILWNDLERDPETVDELKNVKMDESASVVKEQNGAITSATRQEHVGSTHV